MLTISALDNVVFQIAKMARLPLAGMLREPAVSFPSYTRVKFTGHAPLEMLSKNGALSLKFLRSTKSGASAW